MRYVGDDRYEDIREGVRAVCAEFPAEYHRKIDEARGYPEDFVDALTRVPRPNSMLRTPPSPIDIFLREGA